MRPGMGVMAAAAILLAGCVTEQDVLQARENLMIAAGFTQRQANTPERQQELKTLTPHRFLYREQNGKVDYVFADPTVCNCLLIGSEQAYQKYWQLAFQQQIAADNLAAAQINQNTWRWGPWGPGWW